MSATIPDLTAIKDEAVKRAFEAVMAQLAVRPTLLLADGVTAPQPHTGQAALYVESGTGSPSFKMGDGETFPLQGRWTSRAHLASDFTASGAMTWGVDAADLVTFAYTQIGKTLVVAAVISTTTIGGVVSTTLSITIPAGLVAAKRMQTLGRLVDNGVSGVCIVEVFAGGTAIVITRLDGANLTLAANNTSLRFQFAFEVQ